MSEKDQNRDYSSEELNKIIDEYIASLESRGKENTEARAADVTSDPEPSAAVPSDDTPETGESASSDECEKASEIFYAADETITTHFSDVSSLDVMESTQELNIQNHLTDTAPAEITEFNSDFPSVALPGPDDENEPLVEKKPDSDEDDEDIPWYKAAAQKVVAFVWNSGFVLKAVIYLAIVLIISAFLSYYVISIGNDVFAFVKTGKEVTIDVPEGMTRKEISFLLEKNGIIEYDWAFDLFLIYKDCDESTFLPGEHTFNSRMNYSQIISELTEVKRELIEVTVTIPEGYTVDQIIDLFVGMGIGTREKFVEAINEYPYRHEFVKQLEQIGYSENRRYRLEGYLYPDTYNFYKDSPEYLIINKLLNNFNNKFWIYYESVFAEDIEKAGLTFDDIVTLASMIQSEAKLEIDFEYISYVFRNRLSHPNTFPRLESDATVQYALLARGEERVEDLTAEQLAIDDPYNTRLYEGLPPGAICNPGFDALSAAIYPDAPLLDEENYIDAYFFVSNKAGKTYYAETLSGHNENVKQVKKDNQSYDTN